MGIAKRNKKKNQHSFIFSFISQATLETNPKTGWSLIFNYDILINISYVTTHYPPGRDYIINDFLNKNSARGIAHKNGYTINY